MRRLVLREDLKSVSNPQSHALGLVSLCKENPRLRIERRIGLWSNIYPLGWSKIRTAAFDDPDWVDGSNPEHLYHAGTSLGCVLKSLAPWIQEANTLYSVMPSEAFTVVLEGSSSHTSSVWEGIKQVAALQGAQSLYHVQHAHTITPPSLATSPKFQKCHIHSLAIYPPASTKPSNT